MSAPVFVQRTSGAGANLSGFGANPTWVRGKGWQNLRHSGSTGLHGLGEAPPSLRVGLGATAVGAVALYAAYKLWQSNHKVAGVLVGLFFGPSVLVGPEIVAENLKS